jgi:hypothetical protein
LLSTISEVENEPLATPNTVEIEYERDLGYPGVHPFTRGGFTAGSGLSASPLNAEEAGLSERRHHHSS